MRPISILPDTIGDHDGSATTKLRLRLRPLLKHNQHLRTSTPLAAHAKQARPQPTLQMALAAVPAARRMRDRARDALSDVIGGTSTPLRTLAVTALDRHYRVTAAADVDRVARTLFDALAQMNGRLLSARAWLRQGADEGFATTPYPRDGHTYIDLGYAIAGPLIRPTILIHEAFHDLSETHQDYGGNPARDQGAAYHRNDTQTQLVNAYAMSQFVLHIHLGQERILGDTE